MMCQLSGKSHILHIEWRRLCEALTGDIITWCLHATAWFCTDPTRNPSGFETGSSHFATSDQTLWF